MLSIDVTFTVANRAQLVGNCLDLGMAGTMDYLECVGFMCSQDSFRCVCLCVQTS